MELKDSGERRNFQTGAVRDMSQGKGRFDLVSPYAIRRLAVHCEKGAKKYGERNWEKGIPNKSFLDSAMRHINKFAAGEQDEDHLVAAFWNLHCLLHFEALPNPAEVREVRQLIEESDGYESEAYSS